MLRTFAMCLGLGAVGAGLAAALKWAGAFSMASDFLYGFYDQSPLFVKIHGASEFAPGQFAILFVAAAATAWAIASIPQVARRLIIVLGAVLITFFLSPVLALMGWKLEPFSWLVSIFSVVVSAMAVFPVRSLMVEQLAGDEPLQEGEFAPRSQPPSRPSRPLRTPEMAFATAEAAAASSKEQECDPDELEHGRTELPTNLESKSDLRCEASIVLFEVFPPVNIVDGYAGTSRAFLERAGTFLQSAGASEMEQGPDFLRAVFYADNDGEAEQHAHSRLACEAALSLRSHLVEFCAASDSELIRTLRFGIGLESFVWDGTIAELPLSSRDFVRSLCVLNRRYGSTIVVGARAHRLAASSIEARPLELVDEPVSGLPQEVYELLGKSGTMSVDAVVKRDAFWEGIVCLRSGRNDDAVERFGRARSNEGDDPVIDYFEAVSRGEEPRGDLVGDDVVEGNDDLIPAVFYRESDSEDRMEMFVEVDDDIEVPIAPEKP